MNSYVWIALAYAVFMMIVTIPLTYMLRRPMVAKLLWFQAAATLACLTSESDAVIVLGIAGSLALLGLFVRAAPERRFREIAAKES
ncbi:hypothetical protein DVG80_32330 [Rhodococcus erythropolis]|nr:hypothetical protein DVG80_32330 [Rhodococcus erythropolis]